MKSHKSSRLITFGNTFQRVVSNVLLLVEWSISVNDLCNKSSNPNSDFNLKASFRFFPFQMPKIFLIGFTSGE